MNKIVKMVIERFSRSYTQYRFDKISNFLTYKQFQEKEAIDMLIRLGKELERIRDFKNNSNKELMTMVNKWQDSEHVGMSDELFATYQGMDAKSELQRRESSVVYSMSDSPRSDATRSTTNAATHPAQSVVYSK